jgi:hypothetical protein
MGEEKDYENNFLWLQMFAAITNLNLLEIAI